MLPMSSPVENGAGGREIVRGGSAPAPSRLALLLAPLTHLRDKRQQREQAELLDLSEQVVQHLRGQISENGMVSLFHSKATGARELALFTIYLTSPEIPRLYVTMWQREKKP